MCFPLIAVEVFDIIIWEAKFKTFSSRNHKFIKQRILSHHLHPGLLPPFLALFSNSASNLNYSIHLADWVVFYKERFQQFERISRQMDTRRVFIFHLIDHSFAHMRENNYRTPNNGFLHQICRLTKSFKKGLQICIKKILWEFLLTWCSHLSPHPFRSSHERRFSNHEEGELPLRWCAAEKHWNACYLYNCICSVISCSHAFMMNSWAFKFLMSCVQISRWWEVIFRFFSCSFRNVHF